MNNRPGIISLSITPDALERLVSDAYMQGARRMRMELLPVKKRWVKISEYLKQNSISKSTLERAIRSGDFPPSAIKSNGSKSTRYIDIAYNYHKGDWDWR